MTDSQMPPHAQVMNFAMAKFISKPLWVAAQLGIADRLAEGARSTAELAHETQTHEPSLYRILRALASVGIFTETAPRTFGLTPMASTLRSDVPQSVRDVVVFINHPVHDLAWTEILHSVRTGKPGFDKALGAPVFEYLAAHPEFSEIFNRAMTTFATIDIAAVADGYDFSGIASLVDVGGGHGALMMAILERYPRMSGTVFDVPHVIEGTARALQARGLQGRCKAVGGDFFASLPGGDAIIMSHIIHDWDDERCILILRNAARAVPRDGKVLICETVVPPGDAPSPAKLLDLEMLVMPGGLERTREEYAHLLEQAGLRLQRVVATRTAIGVIEAVPA